MTIILSSMSSGHLSGSWLVVFVVAVALVVVV